MYYFVVIITLCFGIQNLCSAELAVVIELSDKQIVSLTSEMFLYCQKSSSDLQAFLELQKSMHSSDDFALLINGIDYENSRTMLRKLVRLALRNGGEEVEKLKLFISYEPNPHMGKDTSLHRVLYYYYEHYKDPQVFERCVEIMELLKSIGQDFNQINGGDETELEFIVRVMVNGEIPLNVLTQMIEKLLEYGADPTHSNPIRCNLAGWSAIDITYRKSRDVLEYCDEKYEVLYQLFVKYGFRASYFAWVESTCVIM